MRPITKFQKEVEIKSKSLSGLSSDHIAYIEDKIIRIPYQTTKNQFICMYCSHRWERNHYDHPNKITCPCCGKKLSRVDANKRTSRVFYDDNAIYIIHLHEGIQVFRCFTIRVKFKTTEKANIKIDEVSRTWMKENGDTAIQARNLMYNYYYTNWNYNSDITWKYDDPKYYPNDMLVYPDVQAYPILFRNGFYGQFFGYNPVKFFKLLLTNNRFETLVKCDQNGLLKYLVDHIDRMDIYWKSIVVAMRQRYRPDDYSIWFDHLRDLTFLKLDLLNPHYICPNDLIETHREYTKLVQAKRTKEYEKTIKEQERKDNIKYVSTKNMFFNLQLQKDNVSLHVLKSINEFKQEGLLMQNCVYSSGYYNEIDSLILSARKGDERIATVEYSLTDMKILQCRAFDNKPCKHTSIIKDILNTNKQSIKSAINAYSKVKCENQD